jgi:hypothetical protein
MSEYEIQELIDSINKEKDINNFKNKKELDNLETDVKSDNFYK